MIYEEGFRKDRLSGRLCLIGVLLARHEAVSHDECASSNADNIRHGAGQDEDEGHDIAGDALPHLQGTEQVASDAAGQQIGGCNDDAVCNDDLHHRAFQQDSGTIHECKGDDESGDGEGECLPAGLPCACTRDACCSKGCQTDGRSDLSHDTEVEDEHIGDQSGDAQTLDSRCEQSDSDQVSGHGRQCHAQQQAAQSGDEQCDEQAALTRGTDELCDLDGNAGVDHDADHDAAGSGGDRNVCGLTDAVHQSLEQLAGTHAGLRRDRCDDDGEDGAVDRGTGQRVAHDDHDDQNDDGQQTVHAGQDGLAFVMYAGVFAQTLLLCDHVDKDEHGEEVGHSGQDGCCCDLRILHTDDLGHDECASAHDGGHDLAAGGSNRLDCCRLFGVITGLFHQGDGQNAGGGNICDCRTRNHAQQAGRDDSCLCGAADRLIAELHAAVDQDTAAAAVGEEGAENEEVEQGAQRSDQRRAEDAILAVHQDFHQFGEADAGEAEQAGDILAEPCISKEEADDPEQGHTDHAADGLHDIDDQKHRHDDLGGGHNVNIEDAVVELFCVAQEEPADKAAGRDEEDVVDPPQLIVALGFLDHRIVQPHHDQCKAHMERQLEPRVKGLDQLDVELEHRPDNGKNCQRIETPFRHILQQLGDFGIFVLFVCQSLGLGVESRYLGFFFVAHISLHIIP